MIVLLVTVLVVSFNQSKYIRENLDSIRDQSYSNIELIVADDAQPIRLWLWKWLQENKLMLNKFHLIRDYQIMERVYSAM
jgi:alpha-1,3-rhamnosyltransferase